MNPLSCRNPGILLRKSGRKCCVNSAPALTTTRKDREMADPTLLTPDDLRKLISYDPGTGKMFWKARTAEWWADGFRTAEGIANNWNSQFAGKEAFTYAMRKGHLQGRIFNRSFLAHRVAWAIHHGVWPTHQIDHINGDPSDNRAANLRDVPNKENHRNMKRPTSNTSGVVGVQWVSRFNLWLASIGIDGKTVYLGMFKRFQDAVTARKEGEAKYGFHPNHGR